MKTLYILFIGLLASASVIAQYCLPEHITFETQAQIYNNNISKGSDVLDSVGIWDQLGPLNNDILGFAFGDNNADTIYAGSRNNGVYRSIDGGASWHQINNGLSGDFIRAIDNNPNDVKTILAGTFNNGLYKSENSGESWHHIPAVNSNTILDIVFNPINGDTVYVTTLDDGVYRSWNAGDNWEYITPENFNNSYRVFIDPNQVSNVYFVSGDTIFQSIDYGNTWLGFYNSPDGVNILSMAIESGNSTVMYVGSFNQLTKTMDGGLSWEILIDTANTIINDIAIDFENSNLLYIASPSTGVYKSENGGNNWVHLDQGGAMITMLKLGFHPQSTQVLYVCSNSYGLLRTGELITSIDEADIQNRVFMNIYPNPSTTQITVKLSESTFKNTSLSIYNISGQEMITHQLSNPKTEIDISHLPAGIYIVKAQSENEVITRKLVVNQ